MKKDDRKYDTPLLPITTIHDQLHKTMKNEKKSKRTNAKPIKLHTIIWLMQDNCTITSGEGHVLITVCVCVIVCVCVCESERTGEEMFLT